MNKVHLKELQLPEFGTAEYPGAPALAEIENRISLCYEAMKARELTHLIVYGDREHFANSMYLTHFDPRFEEAVLILSTINSPLILVGNECVGHLPISPLYNAGKLRHERYQPLSLLSQPRDDSRQLETIFRSEGINQNSKVGCVGWKYFSENEFADYKQRIEIPAFIVDTLRSVCSYQNVVNATDILMSPKYGLRTTCSAYEIAFFEFSNVIASEGMKNLLKNFRADVKDFDLIREYQYNGYPLSCHIGIKSSGNQHYGLSSPVGAMIKKGEPCSTNIGYWGSNICRAGWVAEDENDLPETAKGYLENFVMPYFRACKLWFENLTIGTKGKVLQEIIDSNLPFDDFGIFLNPGHLIHLDEWVSSPIYKNSNDEIRSGMYFQVDIIPRSKKYSSTRMEDGIIIADENLQAQLKQQYPDVYDRCMSRRRFMINELGIQLPNEILPLSNIPAVITPYFLNYKKILSFKP